MIEVQGVSVRFGWNEGPIIHDLSVTFPGEGITVAVGSSGLGKSTLMGLLMGMYTNSDSHVHISGEVRVNGVSPASLRGAGAMAWVPQTPCLFDHLNVLENILLPISADPRVERTCARAAALEWLERMGMSKKQNCRPRELSGGMMTRVSLIRALITCPKYLFLDEPFNGLDLGQRWNMYRAIREARAQPGLATLLTTHNIPEAAVLADRIILLQEIEGRTEAEVLENQAATYSRGMATELDSARRAATIIESRLFH